MTPQLWIGLGFTVALVVFLMITFFIKDTSSPTQYITLHFLTALCGGFAGGFLMGEALFSLQKEMADGAKIAISGTAGFAMFFTVWFTYPKRKREPLKDIIQLSIPEGWSFEQAARAIVKVARSIINIDGFSSDQLAIALSSADIKSPGVKEALLQLKYLSNKLPAYQVTLENGVYHIRKE